MSRTLCCGDSGNRRLICSVGIHWEIMSCYRLLKESLIYGSWLEILASLELILKSFSILATVFLREKESEWEGGGKEG